MPITADVERWLRENAIRCERYRADLSPDACRKYQAANPEQCYGCENAVGGEPITRRRAAMLRGSWNAAKQRRIDVANKKGICARCGRELTLTGRGLCATCRSKAEAAGEMDRYPKRVPLPMPAEVVDTGVVIPATTSTIETTPALAGTPSLTTEGDGGEAPPARTIRVPVQSEWRGGLRDTLREIAGDAVLSEADPRIVRLVRCCHFLAEQVAVRDEAGAAAVFGRASVILGR